MTEVDDDGSFIENESQNDALYSSEEDEEKQNDKSEDTPRRSLEEDRNIIEKYKGFIKKAEDCVF